MTTHHAPGAPLPASFSWRLFLVFFGMLQITLGAGLIVGWAGIAGSMLVDGEAGLTLDQTTQLYGLAASVNYISPLFLGLLLDKFGPRTCSTASNVFVALGCGVFASAKSFSVFALGLALIAFGGPGVQTSLIHLGNLFPSRRFFVMGCVAETITLSFAVFPLMDVIWEMTSLSFRSIFGGLSVLVALSAGCSILLWPDSPYEVVGDDTHDVTREEAMEEQLLLSIRNVKEEKQMDLKDMSFKEQLSSGAYIRLSIFFLVTSWWANFYIATVTTELGDQQLFDLEKQHELARLLSFIDAGAIVCAPLSGYLLDEVGFAPTAVVTILMGVLQMVCLLLAGDKEVIMIFSFVFYAVFRAFLFPYFFASLSRKMGFRFFGILSGMSFCVSGVSQLAIAPLALRVEGDCHEYDDIRVKDCDEGHWSMIHLVQIANLLLLFLIPFLDTRSETLKRRLVQTSTGSTYGSVSVNGE